MRESWTDERLDEFRSDVGGRFDKVEHRFDKVELRLGHIDEKFGAVNERLDRVEGTLQAQGAEWTSEIKAVRGEIKAGFDGFHRLMIQVVSGLGIAVIGLFGIVLAVAIT